LRGIFGIFPSILKCQNSCIYRDFLLSP
jgi:hypothetical protein